MVDAEQHWTERWRLFAIDSEAASEGGKGIAAARVTGEGWLADDGGGSPEMTVLARSAAGEGKEEKRKGARSAGSSEKGQILVAGFNEFRGILLLVR
ncbi:hypothetical protein FXO37_22243 [Capsicum annuum]|nr:hypothetical protein FXO37_22243 [Capsicum annuum]